MCNMCVCVCVSLIESKVTLKIGDICMSNSTVTRAITHTYTYIYIYVWTYTCHFCTLSPGFLCLLGG